MDLKLPNGWVPRPYQRALWDYLENGGKRAVAVWHRRAGKDDIGLHFSAVQAHLRIGNYWHMLPEAAQARKAIWEAINPHTGKRRIDEAFPPEVRAGQRDDEMIIRFISGSTWQIVGSDNYNSLIGSPPIGVVFSEFAVAKPQAWDFIRPILAENGGWALFIYTARGRNHGADLFEMAQKNPSWFAQRLTVDDTGVLSRDVIDEERRSGMSEEMIRQEYYCSFDAAVVGSYYGELMNKAADDNRIGAVPYDPGALVTTGWDLGYGDDTAIWFAQIVGAEPRIIDYYENRGQAFAHYAKIVKEKPYVYAKHLLPHDGAHGELLAGTTIVKEATALLGHNVEVLPRIGVDDGINAARTLIGRCRFDADKCAQGIKALRLYRRKWNEERKAFDDRPLHDWTSHAADGFRYLSLGLRSNNPMKKPVRESYSGGWLAA